jgi:hypothetical protein
MCSKISQQVVLFWSRQSRPRWSEEVGRGDRRSAGENGSIMKYFVLLLATFLLTSCEDKNAQFRLLDASETGVDFVNDLQPTADLNIFNYMYFYNGGGVGAGDLNNDGLVDLIFTTNRNSNRLLSYLFF